MVVQAEKARIKMAAEVVCFRWQIVKILPPNSGITHSIRSYITMQAICQDNIHVGLCSKA